MQCLYVNAYDSGVSHLRVVDYHYNWSTIWNFIEPSRLHFFLGIVAPPYYGHTIITLSNYRHTTVAPTNLGNQILGVHEQYILQHICIITPSTMIIIII